MAETRRKTKTPSAVKNRYNKKVYDRVTVCLPRETAEAFKKKCLELGIPQAQVVKEAVAEFLSKQQG